MKRLYILLILLGSVLHVSAGLTPQEQILRDSIFKVYHSMPVDTVRVEYLKDEETRNLLVKEHKEIYEAIKKRDVKSAKEISYQHIENQREAIIRSIREENQDR